MNKLLLALIFLQDNRIKTCKVKFEVEIPSFTPPHSKIYIAGSFNGWNPSDTNYILQKDSNNKYSIALEFNAGQRIEFKFTRGSWDYVEKGERGEEIPNRIIDITNDTVLQIKVKNWRDFVENEKRKKHTITGNVITLTLSSKFLKYYNPRKIWIYIPPDYDSATRNYPVLYMHDGQNLFDETESFAGEWGVDEILEEMYKESKFSLIVVGIENAREHRIDEYSPFFNPNLKRGGEADNYINFIIDELRPYIDSHYRTLKNDYALLGSSLGGLVSIYAGFKYPDIFRKVCSISGAFWFNPEIIEFIKNAKQIPEKIYIDYGKHESEDPQKYIEENERVIKTIKEKDTLKKGEIMVIVDDKGIHHESSWHKRLRKAIEFLFIN